MPCGLSIDMERARFARRGIIEMRNSRGEWEQRPAPTVSIKLGDAMVLANDRWQTALSLARTLDGLGFGNLCKLESGRGKRYGREVSLGIRREKICCNWLRGCGGS